MTNDVIGLMVDAIQEQLGEDAAAFKPADEEDRFLVHAKESTVLIDAERRVFVPLEKGDAAGYLDLKSFLEEIGLSYVPSSGYRRDK